MNDPRCPVDNVECTDDSQARIVRNNTYLDLPATADQRVAEHGQQSDYQHTNGEQSIGPCSPDNETDQAVSQRRNGQEQQSGYQQTCGEQSSGPSSPDETNQAVNQMMNGQEQQSDYQQADGGQVNGLMSYSVQETGVHQAQRANGQPYAEAGCDQACGCSYPVQETGHVPFAGRRPGEHEDMSPCHQQHNGDHINEVSSVSQREEAMEHNCSGRELQLWNQKQERSKPQKATRNKRNPTETYFIVRITEVTQHRQADVNGEATAIFSPAIHTDKYEYKLGIRVYPNGVGEGRGRYVAIFAHMMKGEYDDVHVPEWPFTQRISFSFLDQSGAKCHISQIMQAKPNLQAFQKPTEVISRTGCGFVKFASIEEVFSPRYVKDDTLFLKIEFSA